MPGFPAPSRVTSLNIDSIHPSLRSGEAAARTDIRRQAGCMAKAEQRRKSPRLPKQVKLAIHAASDKQASDMAVLDLRKAGGFTDFFLICSAGNARQIRAIADGIQEALATEGVKPAHVEGYDRSEW